jgi:hypothetical protein
MTGFNMLIRGVLGGDWLGIRGNRSAVCPHSQHSKTRGFLIA